VSSRKLDSNPSSHGCKPSVFATKLFHYPLIYVQTDNDAVLLLGLCCCQVTCLITHGIPAQGFGNLTKRAAFNFIIMDLCLGTAPDHIMVVSKTSVSKLDLNDWTHSIVAGSGSVSGKLTTITSTSYHTYP